MAALQLRKAFHFRVKANKIITGSRKEEIMYQQAVEIIFPCRIKDRVIQFDNMSAIFFQIYFLFGAFG